MNVTFKSNLPKKELIQKVKEAVKSLEIDQNVRKIPIHSTNQMPTPTLFNKDNDLFILTELESEKKRCYWLFFNILLS